MANVPINIKGCNKLIKSSYLIYHISPVSHYHSCVSPLHTMTLLSSPPVTMTSCPPELTRTARLVTRPWCALTLHTGSRVTEVRSQRVRPPPAPAMAARPPSHARLTTSSPTFLVNTTVNYSCSSDPAYSNSGSVRETGPECTGKPGFVLTLRRGYQWSNLGIVK